MENTENKVPQGWRDVQIVPDMPLSALVNFLNVLNQRLCALEDIVTVPGEDGKAISLTDLYALQAEAAIKDQAEAAEKGE